MDIFDFHLTMGSVVCNLKFREFTHVLPCNSQTLNWLYVDTISLPTSNLLGCLANIAYKLEILNALCFKIKH